MALSATLNSPVLTVMPGDTTSCDIQVRNTGQVVDQYAVGLLGDVQEWATVEPPVLNLYPGEAGTARITFNPPKSSKVHAGVVPFGLRIASREDPHGSRVEEGQVEILPFEEVRAELVPHVSSGRRSARFDLAVDNLGNYPMDVELFAEDPNDQLRFRLTRAAATVAPGTATLVRFQARPRKGFLRGQDKSHPPVNADGAMVQQPLLPRWLLPALAALLAVILILVALWFTVFKPVIQSTAKAEAQQQNQQLAAAVQGLRQQAALNAAGGGKAGAGSGGAGAAAAGNAGAVPPSGSVAPAPPPAPASFRMVTSAPANQAPGTFTVTNLPANMQGVPLGITDMLFQNPAGDTGDLQIRKKSGSTTVVLADFSLVNFRDEDYHLLEPWEFTKTDQLQIAVNCQNGTGKPVTGACTAGVSFSGLAG